MKCETAQQVFSEYMEETIERPLALTFERHINQCEECQRAYKDFRSTWRILETAFPGVEAPSDFRKNMLGRIKAQQEVADQESGARTLDLRSVLGIRIPARVFAWALSVLIFAVLLVKVSPGVFRSSLTGPFSGAWITSAGPGMEVGVRALEPGMDADVYQIVLEPTSGVGEIEATLTSLTTGEQYCRTEALGGRKTTVPIVVKQPQGTAEPLSMAVRWKYSNKDFCRVIYLPRSQVAAQQPYAHAWNGRVHDALRLISAEYGVVVSADAGVKGSVTLSGKYDSAKAALDQVADEIGLEVRKEGSRAFRLEPR